MNLLPLVVVATVLLSAGAYVKGRIDGADIANAEHAEAALKQARESRRATFALTGLVIDAERRVLDEQGRIRTETEFIVQRIPAHVTPEIDRRYPLPCGFVRVHNAAAERRPVSDVAVAGCRADADPAPIAASDAARVIAGNYGAYHEAVAQLKGWQDYYRQALIVLHPPTEAVAERDEPLRPAE